jgi:flagellar basal body-associated protein FliL
MSALILILLVAPGLLLLIGIVAYFAFGSKSEKSEDDRK